MSSEENVSGVGVFVFPCVVALLQCPVPSSTAHHLQKYLALQMAIVNVSSVVTAWSGSKATVSTCIFLLMSAETTT